MGLSDLTIVPANVEQGAVTAGFAPVFQQIVLGETVAAITPVYYDIATQRYKAADCDDTSKYNVAGLCWNGGDDGDSDQMLTSGEFTIGTTSFLTQFRTYVLSDTAGSIMLATDLSSGDRWVQLGHAITDQRFRLDIKDFGTVA